MKREFLIELIPDATKEVIDQILDANGKDIENAQGSHKKTKEDLAAANQKIAEYEQEIESLKDATANADALKLKVRTGKIYPGTQGRGRKGKGGSRCDKQIRRCSRRKTILE